MFEVVDIQLVFHGLSPVLPLRVNVHDAEKIGENCRRHDKPSDIKHPTTFSGMDRGCPPFDKDDHHGAVLPAVGVSFASFQN